MDHQERLDTIIASILEAQFDPTRWPPTSKLIDDACGLIENSLSVARDDRGGHPEMVVGKIYKRRESHDELKELYVENSTPIDERVPIIFGKEDGTYEYLDAVFVGEEHLASLTHNEFVVPTCAMYTLNLQLSGPAGLDIIWSLGRSADSSPWSMEQVQMIQKVSPHIRHLVRAWQAQADVAARAVRTTTDALGVKRVGVVFLDRAGRIVEANDYGRALLSASDGLANRRRYLVANHSEDTETVIALLGRVVSNGKSGATSIRRSNCPPLVLHLLPVGAQAEGFNTMPGFAVMALIVDPLDRPHVDPIRLGDALGLTPAQARVAAALSSGGTVRSIAAASYRSEAVVRWHLKQIMARLGLFGQSDLVRLVLTTPGISTAESS